MNRLAGVYKIISNKYAETIWYESTSETTDCCDGFETYWILVQILRWKAKGYIYIMIYIYMPAIVNLRRISKKTPVTRCATPAVSSTFVGFRTAAVSCGAYDGHAVMPYTLLSKPTAKTYRRLLGSLREITKIITCSHSFLAIFSNHKFQTPSEKSGESKQKYLNWGIVTQSYCILYTAQNSTWLVEYEPSGHLFLQKLYQLPDSNLSGNRKSPSAPSRGLPKTSPNHSQPCYSVWIPRNLSRSHG